jgi:hypothetical protein
MPQDMLILRGPTGYKSVGNSMPWTRGLRPGVVQISLFVESSQKPLSIVCKKGTANQ